MRRRDAERHEHAVAARARAARVDRRGERGLVADQVVGRQHQQHGVVAVARLRVKRGERDRRRRVAAERLEQERRALGMPSVQAGVHVRVWK